MAPIRPGLAIGPTRSTGAAAPWSVPSEAFSATRRPNSLKAITTTRSAWPAAARSSWNAAIESDSSFKQRVMGPELIGVGVEPVERRVEDPGAELGLDHLGDQLQAAGQPEIRVLRPVARLGASCSSRLLDS